MKEPHSRYTVPRENAIEISLVVILLILLSQRKREVIKVYGTTTGHAPDTFE